MAYPAKRLTAAALLLLLTLPAVAAPHYKVTDVGPIQQEDTFAVNSHGQVIGSNFFAAVDQGIKPAWVWTHGRRTLIKPQKGYECVIDCAINDRGEVAGDWATTSDGATLSVEHQAFIWQAGRFRDLTVILNSPYSEAAGINSSGRVVGIVAGSDRSVEDDPRLTALRAFLFPGKRGSVQFLGPGRAEALNDRGQVVGEDGLEAVEWVQGRKRKLGVQGRSVAVNSRGQILINERGPGFNRPLLWQNGTARSFRRRGFTRPALARGPCVRLEHSPAASFRLGAGNRHGHQRSRPGCR